MRCLYVKQISKESFDFEFQTLHLYSLSPVSVTVHLSSISVAQTLYAPWRSVWNCPHTHAFFIICNLLRSSNAKVIFPSWRSELREDSEPVGRRPQLQDPGEERHPHEGISIILLFFS